MKPACAMCIIGTLEQNYDPSEINQNNLSQIIPNISDKCNVKKQKTTRACIDKQQTKKKTYMINTVWAFCLFVV